MQTTHKRCNVKAALRQAFDNCNGKTKYPIAITREDNEQAIVTMSLDDFKDVVGQWWQLKPR